MQSRTVEVDERTVAVDHAAGNLAYKVMSWLLVADLAIRSKWPGVTDWNGYPVDVLAVIFAGCGAWLWQAGRNGIVGRRYLRQLIISLAVGAVVAAAMIWWLRQA